MADSFKVPDDQVYWITRDLDSKGQLSELVDVWLSKPVLVYQDQSCAAYWVSGLGTIYENRFAQWDLALTHSNCHVVPDTVRECICVGVK